MRIAYCTNVRLPSERAHGHQVARVCDALVHLGHAVMIFAPYRENRIRDDYWGFHGADRRTALRLLGSFDPIDHHFLPKILQLPILNAQLKFMLGRSLKPEQFDVIYTRTPALLPFLLSTKIPVILELHTIPQRNPQRFIALCNRCALVVCLTSAIREELLVAGVKENLLLTESDAVDFNRFTSALPMHLEDRSKPVIGYAGQMETMGLSKGIPEFIDALDLLQKQHIPCVGYIAGPPPANTHLLQKLQSPNVRSLGFLPHDRIAGFLAACDMLVYPAPKSDHPFYNRDTSPLKIFEYMAAGKPIVTADLPPIRDVLDEHSAFFCKPGDPADLARSIAHVLSQPQEARKRAEVARKKVERYAWDKRMERIINRANL
jgi:glycosyltransferase involved in cell wall biosynthesis